MVTTVKSCTLVGIDAELADVECTIARGLPQYSVAGLAALSVKEGATRIQSALKAVGYDLRLVTKRRSFTACSIDWRIKVARMIVDLLGQDDIDAGCLLEAAAYRDVEPTADVVPPVL